jgi:hypothetical protein
MKSTKTVRETVTIGEGKKEIRLVAHREGDSPPMSFIVDGWELELPPEDVERVAAVLAEMRRVAGDYRAVCADHGYFEGRDTAYRCPGCNPPKAIEDGDAVAEAVS